MNIYLYSTYDLNTTTGKLSIPTSAVEKVNIEEFEVSKTKTASAILIGLVLTTPFIIFINAVEREGYL